nr:DUF2334 domain-containing protein [Bacillus suaedae]
MIRLEDVGPGGEYNSFEDLGKLRAVMDYLESNQIPFHVAVIPRMINVEKDGTWTEKGIDDPNPNSFVEAFIQLLQKAEQQGAILGMHGYSHQYGSSINIDNNHISGIGSEFDVEGAPETKRPSYAAERITNSLAAFEKAGIQPAFWESPHYQDTREQEKVFRSYMGILYQPDFFSLRSLKDINAYDTTNLYGQSSLGSIYVPAPFSYVTDEASLDRILLKASKDNGLGSLFFHPFLEFPFLVEVLGTDGKQVMQDGLPLYKYSDEDEKNSYLHRLVEGFGREGYSWKSLHEVIPFTPAHRVILPLDSQQERVLTGDITDDNHADMLVVKNRRAIVIPGRFTFPRNQQQHASEVWLEYEFTLEDQVLLLDWNKDGKEDLAIYNQQTGELRVGMAKEGHFEIPISLGKLPTELESLQVFHSFEDPGFVAREDDQILFIHFQNDELVIKKEKVSRADDADLYIGSFQNSKQDDLLFVSLKEQSAAIFHYQSNGRLSKANSVEGVNWARDAQLLVGDPDGNGISDLILYDAKTGIWQEYMNQGEAQFYLLENSFGPWAKGKGRKGVVTDFDGNGKTDIASYDEVNQLIDIALSFQK